MNRQRDNSGTVKTRQILKPPHKMSRPAILVESAMMAALGFVLSAVPFFRMPWGGSVTFFSTLPIILMSFRHGLKWGVSTAAVFGILQALQGANNVAAAGSLGAMALCVLLDYFLAYACVGFSGPVARFVTRGGASAIRKSGRSESQTLKIFKYPAAGLVAGITLTGLMRLFFSFLSGVLIWGAWAPEGVPVWQYSLSYNAGWCLPDVAAALAAALVLSRVSGLYLLDG